MAFDPGQDSKPIEAQIQVANATTELRRPNINMPVLRQLGKVVAIDQLATIPKQLQGEVKWIDVHREASIWDNWLVLLLLVVVYCVDIGLRRMAGLSLRQRMRHRMRQRRIAVATNLDYRRRLSILTAIGLAAVCGLGAAAVEAQSPAAPPPTTAAILTEARIVERVTTAVDRALGYMASKQQSDGAWTDNQAVNSLAILSYLGRGNVPGRGPYRDLLARAKRFILASQQPNGLFASPRPSHGPMYEHALSTLACAEMYGMDPDPELEEKLRKAVDLILKAEVPTAAGVISLGRESTI